MKTNRDLHLTILSEQVHSDNDASEVQVVGVGGRGGWLGWVKHGPDTLCSFLVVSLQK